MRIRQAILKTTRGGTNMNSRSREILNILIRKHTTITLADLAIRLGISERGVRYALDELNHFLGENKVRTAKLDRKKGIQFELTDFEKGIIISKLLEHEELDTYVTSEERFLLIVLMLVEAVWFDGKKLMSQFSISKTTLQKDIKRVELFLRKFNLTLENTIVSGYFIKGKEIDKRNLFIDVCFRYTNLNDLFSSLEDQHFLSLSEKNIISYLGLDNLKETMEILRIINKKIGNRLTNSSLLQLTISINFQKTRILKGRKIVNKNNIILPVGFSNHNLLEKIEKEIFTDLVLSDNERRYLFQTLSSISHLTVSSTGQSINWLEGQLVMLEIVNFIENQLKVDFIMDKEFSNNLYRHVQAMIIRIISNKTVYNPLTAMIKIKYKETFELVELAIRKIEARYSKHVPDNEIAFLTVYFRTLIDSSISQRRKFCAVIICGQGVVTGKLLQSNLSEYVDLEILGVFNSHEVTTLQKMPIDFVISTTPIENVSLPQIVLSPFVEEKEIERLTDFLKTIEVRSSKTLNNETDFFKQIILSVEKNSSHLNINNFSSDLEVIFKQYGLQIERRLFQPMLKDVVTKEMIQLDLDAKNWEDAIEIAARPLLDKEFIEPRYVDAMVQSVHDLGPYMVIDEYVALAHARPQDGTKKIGVSFLTIPEGISFQSENDPVKIVICLSAIDSVSHLKLLASLADVITNKEDLNRLIHSKNKEEFMDLLFDYE